MPKYVIEREIPGAGRLTPEELKAISQKSCGVLREMGPQIQWVESFVTDDKIYCVYLAPNVEAVREHPQRVRCYTCGTYSQNADQWFYRMRRHQPTRAGPEGRKNLAQGASPGRRELPPP